MRAGAVEAVIYTFVSLLGPRTENEKYDYPSFSTNLFPNEKLYESGYPKIAIGVPASSLT